MDAECIMDIVAHFDAVYFKIQVSSADSRTLHGRLEYLEEHQHKRVDDGEIAHAHVLRIAQTQFLFENRCRYNAHAFTPKIFSEYPQGSGLFRFQRSVH